MYNIIYLFVINYFINKMHYFINKKLVLSND